jgi:hypothetical protein
MDHMHSLTLNLLNTLKIEYCQSYLDLQPKCLDFKHVVSKLKSTLKKTARGFGLRSKVYSIRTASNAHNKATTARSLNMVSGALLNSIPRTCNNSD